MPRAASEGHPRAQPLLVHLSLRQVRAGRGEELFSPASLRGVREINEADLYTIQFIAGGGWGGEEMPLVPPRPLRPRKTTIHRPWVQVSQQVGSEPRRSVVPPSAPAASQRAIKVDPEHSWGGGRGRRGGRSRLAAPQLRVFSSTAPRIISEMLLFSTRRGGSGVRR